MSEWVQLLIYFAFYAVGYMGGWFGAVERERTRAAKWRKARP